MRIFGVILVKQNLLHFHMNLSANVRTIIRHYPYFLFAHLNQDFFFIFFVDSLLTKDNEWFRRAGTTAQHGHPKRIDWRHVACLSGTGLVGCGLESDNACVVVVMKLELKSMHKTNMIQDPLFRKNSKQRGNNIPHHSLLRLKRALSLLAIFGLLLCSTLKRQEHNFHWL